MQKAVIYATAGQIGSGKTTLGRKLAAEKKALFFSADQWIAGLGVPIGSHEVYAKYYVGCENRIREVALQAMNLGISVVFDFGVNQAKGRKGLKVFAQTSGFDLVIYHLNVPLDICRERVRDRNHRKPPGIHSFDFSDEDFDIISKNYDAPTSDEDLQVIEVVGGI